MNHKFILLTVLAFALSFSQLVACSCGSSFSDDFRASDFVGHVKFKKANMKSKGDPYYSVEVEIIEKYKGPDLKTIWINNDELCPFHIQPKGGEELVIFSRIDHLGNFSIHECSGNFSPHQKHRSLEVQILEKLKNFNLEYVQDFRFDTNNLFFNKSWRLEIDLQEKNFAIYEVTYDRLNFFSEVKVLEGFGEGTDKKIMSLIMKSDWHFYSLYSDFDPKIFRFLIILEKEIWEGKQVIKYNYL